MKFEFFKNTLKGFLNIYLNIIFGIISFHKKNKFLSKYFLAKEFYNISKIRPFQLFSGNNESYILLSNDFTISQEVYLNGEFGFSTFLKVKNILGPNFIINQFIEIGANIGTVTIPVVKRGFALSAHCFEPSPLNYSLLNANLALNNLTDNVTSYNLALGDCSNKDLIFELSDINSGDHRVRVSDESGVYDEHNRVTISVQSERLDKVLPDLFDKYSTLVWIDTQGYEGYILKGAQNILKNQIPIVVEFWPYGLQRAGCYSEFKDACLNYSFYYNLSDVSPIKMELNIHSFDELYNSYRHTEATDLLLI